MSAGGRSGAVVLRAVLPVAAWFVALQALLLLAADGGLLGWLQEWSAAGGAWLLRASGVDLLVVGCDISIGTELLVVSPACIPAAAVSLAASLLATERRLTVPARLAWVTGATVIVLAVNIVRIFAVGLLLDSGVAWAEAVHLHVMPVLLALLAVGTWRVATRGGRREP